MSAATVHAKVLVFVLLQPLDSEIDPLCFADTSDIPPPVPHIMPTREQFERSMAVGLAQARAGMGEDFEVVQARMRAKFFPSSR